MNNRLVLAALLASLAGLDSHTGYAQTPKLCTDLNQEILTEHAKQGYLPAGASGIPGTLGWIAGFASSDKNAKHSYYEWLTPSGSPPPAKECPVPPGFTLVAECLDSSFTAGPITYQYWRCIVPEPPPRK